MKVINLISLVILLGIITSCSKTNDEKSREENNARLKKVEANIIHYRFGKPAPSTRELWASEEYDQDGKLSKKKYMPSADPDFTLNIIRTEKYKYSGEKPIEMTVGLTDFNVDSRFAYEYTGGNLSQVTEFKSYGAFEKVVYTYNDAKRIDTKTAYSYIGGEHPFTISKYHYEGKLVSYIDVKFASGSSEYQLIYEYDNRGNMVKETYKEPATGKNSSQKLLAFHYTDDGRIAERIENTYYTIEFVMSDFEYNEKGQISHIDVFKGPSLIGPFEQVAEIEYTYTYY